MDSSEQFRKNRALELGLPENSTYGDICNFTSEQYRKNRALELGLPENATYGDICNFDSEQFRKKMALELGLPVTSTYGEINYFTSEIDRKKRALELGLSVTSTWGDISNFYSGNTKIDMNIDVNTYKRSNFEITIVANKKPKGIEQDELLKNIVKEGLINRGKRKIE
jgi:hypothetical protein